MSCVSYISSVFFHLSNLHNPYLLTIPLNAGAIVSIKQIQNLKKQTQKKRLLFSHSNASHSLVKQKKKKKPKGNDTCSENPMLCSQFHQLLLYNLCILTQVSKSNSKEFIKGYIHHKQYLGRFGSQ